MVRSELGPQVVRSEAQVQPETKHGRRAENIRNLEAILERGWVEAHGGTVNLSEKMILRRRKELIHLLRRQRARGILGTR